MLCGSLNESGVWRRIDTCAYNMAESLCCPPETIPIVPAVLQYKIKSLNIYIYIYIYMCVCFLKGAKALVDL